MAHVYFVLNAVKAKWRRTMNYVLSTLILHEISNLSVVDHGFSTDISIGGSRGACRCTPPYRTQFFHFCIHFSGGSRISHRGGHGPIRGGMDLRRGCFLAKMYVKMKEFGPIGDVHPAHPLDLPMHFH